jgi:hypothetical protein
MASFFSPLLLFPDTKRGGWREVPQQQQMAKIAQKPLLLPAVVGGVKNGNATKFWRKKFPDGNNSAALSSLSVRSLSPLGDLEWVLGFNPIYFLP